MELGYCEGDTCGRDGCDGVIESHDVENCSCHLNAPCGSCTSPRGFCPECDWQESEDPPPPQPAYTGTPWVMPEPRPLDPTKVDWRSAPHSGCSMIKEGVYPAHLTCADVEKEVRGTFGGRFERFGNGHFKYIAYTD